MSVFQVVNIERMSVFQVVNIERMYYWWLISKGCLYAQVVIIERMSVSSGGYDRLDVCILKWLI